MYLYQATNDPFLLEVAVEMLESIEHYAKTSCGYATVSSESDMFFLLHCLLYITEKWCNITSDSS